MGKLTALLGLLIVLGVVAYLDSPASFINRNYAYSASEPVAAQPIDDTHAANQPDIEERLIQTEKEDGYIVKTYREYEIYKDKDGNVVKQVPTSKTDTLKYWDYQNN